VATLGEVVVVGSTRSMGVLEPCRMKFGVGYASTFGWVACKGGRLRTDRRVAL
jgi:hypothetical protein